ncbi:segregation/condensation protein A [Streptomyces sp. NPDC051776]|uniref:segregation/condensation protein A n=1 Tax=Streptomyces sp. NPDC051776 TaxID=3155414 RepID=UPI003427D43B
MPTNDASAPRPARRSLGRGPGTAQPSQGPAQAVPGPGHEAVDMGHERDHAPGSEPGYRSAEGGPEAYGPGRDGSVGPDPDRAAPPPAETAGAKAPGPNGDDADGPAPEGTGAEVPEGPSAERPDETTGAPVETGEVPVETGEVPEETSADGDGFGAGAKSETPTADTEASTGETPAPAAEPPAPAAEPPAPVVDTSASAVPQDHFVPVGAEGTREASVRGEVQRGDTAQSSTTAGGGEEAGGRFTVRLANFEGPFDLLLQLISKHKLDVTEVALSKVTDEFMAHIRAMGADWDLDQTTEFLVVAATLLDLKAARLLPAAEVEDEADLALLEARDLLFARLLQYRAYKQIADIFSERLAAEAQLQPRTVGLEPHHAELLPEVVISIGLEGFAKLAVKAMQPKAKPQVYVDHIHAPLVSVREQAEVVVARLREAGEASFLALIEDAPDTLTVVARFLALLELYRERAVVLDQEEALGTLMVRWTGGEDGREPVVTDEFDQVPGEQAAEKEKENA